MTMRERVKDHQHISKQLLSSLKMIAAGEQPFTEDKTVISLKKIINHRRTRDGRSWVTNKEMIRALESYLDGERNSAAVEELTDALSNLEESRSGFDRFGPLTGS